MKKFNYKSRKGFTLIELLVVIGILAVLAAIAIPSVAGLIDRANISSDDTNANEMTNAIERFVSEYELYCQDIASNRIDFDNLDSAQSRVYNVTAIEEREHITQIENGGYINRKLDKDTKYPDDYGTTVAIIQNYTKTSSSTFEPKQSDMHYWYSPNCGIVVYGEPESPVSVLNEKIISGKDAKGKELTDSTRWIDITTGEETEYVTNYNSEEIEKNPLVFPIGKTKPEYVLAEFNENFTEVTIFKNGENSDGLMMDWRDRNPVLHYDTIQKANIMNGVKNIGNYAFFAATSLKTINLPSTIECIGNSAFAGSSFYNISLNKNLKTIGVAAFENCKNLQSLTMPNTLTNIDIGAFSNCSNIKTLVLNEGLTTIGNSAFYRCSAISEIIIPDTVTSIGQHAFYSCSNAKIIKISNNITTISNSCFAYCTAPEIIIPDTVTRINTNAFGDCSMTSIKMSKNIQKIELYAFRNCTSLKEIAIPSTLTTVEGASFYNLANNSIIYCETQTVADLLTNNGTYKTNITSVVVDPSKF